MFHEMRGGYSALLSLLVRDYLEGKKNLIGIEIGSYAGESASIFLSKDSFKTLYCIDPWEMNYDPDDEAGDEHIVEAEAEFDRRFNNCKQVVKLKHRSNEVVSLFQDESIDFIYIDGCHLYDAFKQDLENYVPKIKHGGIISGHDWHDHWKVPQALREYFKRDPLSIYPDGGSWVYIKD